jgi:hypothetical protein|tara:strand:+ start:10704 stop:11147 length:444 start_codon:yes stop_codon:yes gene_type:complete
MNFQEMCNHCGHKKTAYTANINKPLLEAFIKFVQRYYELKRSLKISEIRLTNSQYNNFQKLKYFGIIDQAGTQGWYLTEFGAKFYKGEAYILSPVAHIDGKALSADHPAWRTSGMVRKQIKIYDILPYHYKQRSEFAAEKAQQQRMV